MDELEWLKEQSPPTRPSRDTTKRHRTQLRAAIVAEDAEGTQPRRPRRERRSRHRVLVTTAVVVALCAVGAGMVALTSSGGDDGNTVGAPVSSDATTDATAAPAPACAGAPPKVLAIPAGFGNGVAAPAKQATSAPASTQQVTTWSSGQATIEQRWPADADAVAKFGTSNPPADRFSSFADPKVVVDAKGAVHRTVLFTFAGQSKEFSALQVTVYGADAGTVKTLSDNLIREPFVPSEPLVTTTGAAAAAPDVVACAGVAEKVAVPVVATIGEAVSRGEFAQPADALSDFLSGQKTLAPHGYRALQLDDGSIVYVKDVQSNVVTTVHVVPTKAGWTVDDWKASGC